MVTRKAGPAISTIVQPAVSAQPIGPARTAAALPKVRLAAEDLKALVTRGLAKAAAAKERPSFKVCLATALATMSDVWYEAKVLSRNKLKTNWVLPPLRQYDYFYRYTPKFQGRPFVYLPIVISKFPP